MKIHKSLPKNEHFFGYYAKLIPTLFKVGFLSQAFSALIETYILYSILLPKFQGVTADPAEAALLGALFLVVLLEVGLRASWAYSVRGVLYRKWRGLDLPMSIFIFALSGSLLLCSVVLHIEGAKEAVEVNTAAPTLEKTERVEDSGKEEARNIAANYMQDKETIEAAYNARIKASRAKHKAREEAYKAKQGATKRGAARLREKGEAEAAYLEAQKLAKTEAALTAKNKQLETIKGRQFAAVDNIAGRNQKARERSEERLEKYSSYLSTFSVLTVFFFLLTIALNEIHKKGSGIEEVAIPNQYQFEQPLFAKLSTAVNGKLQYHARRGIDKIEESTPGARAPLAPAPLYDWAGLSPERIQVGTRGGTRYANSTSGGGASVTMPAQEEARPLSYAYARNNATVTEDPFAKTCKQCEKAFSARVAWQKFCSESCKLDYHEERTGKRFDPKQYRKKGGG